MDRLIPHATKKSDTAVPKVSVAMITYNHEAFIGQAIEGVLMQEVDFPIELIIGEDCSTDRTREIARSYQTKHPDIITISNYPRNMGAGHNFRTTIKSCRGKYIAFLDGDDYWTSPHKLQKQADLLDRQSNLSMCFHSILQMDDRSRDTMVVKPTIRRRVYQLRHFSNYFHVQNSAICFRNIFRNGAFDFPPWFQKTPCGDWGLYVLNAQRGNVGYIDEVMGVYRVHIGGNQFELRKNKIAGLHQNIHMVKTFIDHLGPEANAPFIRALYKRYYDLAHCYAENGDYQKAKDYARRCLHERGFWYNLRVSPLQPLEVLVNLYAPFLYRGVKFLRRASAFTWRRLRT